MSPKGIPVGGLGVDRYRPPQTITVLVIGLPWATGEPASDPL
jgi:hypothetical protein